MIRALGEAVRTGWRPSGLYRLATASGAVRYRVVRADEAKRGERPTLVVGLHGFGSDERQVGTMLALDLSGPVVYLAPRAPLSEGRGFSWFDLRPGSDGQPEPVPSAVDRGLDRLHAFARGAGRAWDTDPVRQVLVGYSQGGALALVAALRAPGVFSTIAAFAAGMPETGTPRVPLFIGTGTLDPFADRAALRHRLEVWDAAGAEVTVSEAEATHVVTARHRADLSAWLRVNLSASPNEDQQRG